MVMLLAPGIERCVTAGTAVVALQVAPDGQDLTAGTAHHRRSLPGIGGPSNRRMIRQDLVTGMAAVEGLAAGEPDGHPVQGAPVVCAPGFRVRVHAQDTGPLPFLSSRWPCPRPRSRHDVDPVDSIDQGNVVPIEPRSPSIILHAPGRRRAARPILIRSPGMNGASPVIRTCSVPTKKASQGRATR